MLLLLGLAAIWWWTSHVPVSPPQVPELSARIPFPALRLDDPSTAIAQLDRKDEIVIPHDSPILEGATNQFCRFAAHGSIFVDPSAWKFLNAALKE